MKKKTIILSTLLVIALAAGLVLTGCAQETKEESKSATYQSGDYKLEIKAGRYAPQNGDTYVLTIISTGKKSIGTVTVSGTTLTLKPSVAGAPEFTIIISGTEIESIKGTITCEDGQSAETPKMIKITGITLSVGNTSDKDTNGEACVFIYTKDLWSWSRCRFGCQRNISLAQN